MRRDDDQEPMHPLGTRQNVSFVLLAGSTLLGIVFGDAANNIAQWVTCIFASGACSDHAKATASALATLIVTFVAVYAASFAPHSDANTRTEADLAILGAFAGALIALFKAAEGQGGYPEIDLFGRPLIVYFVAVAVVFIPMMLRRRKKLSLHAERTFSTTIAIVVVVSAIVSGVWQIVLTELWEVVQDNSSARKFVVAPMAPIMATSVSAVLLLNLWNELRVRTKLATGWLFVASLAAVVFFTLAYLPENGAPTGWMTHTDATATSVGIHYLLILLSGVMMITVLTNMPGEHLRSLPRIGVTGVFVLLSAYSGFVLGQARQSTGALLEGQPAVLALIHGLGPAVGLVSCYGGVRVQQWITARW